MRRTERRQPPARIIPASKLRRTQLAHFAICNAVPFTGTVFALLDVLHRSVTRIDVVLLASMWILTGGLGVSVGFHRYFAHRLFNAGRFTCLAMAVAGSMAAQGPVAYWVAVHRRHHECSDRIGDPHSPVGVTPGLVSRIAAFFHSHVGWVLCHDVPNPGHYAPDILADPALRQINGAYYLIVTIGIILPACLGYVLSGGLRGAIAGGVWGGLLRIAVVNQIIWSINSICHSIGCRDHETHDNSRNNLWLAIPSFGEAWHNNHHAAPSLATLGRKWWQIDTGYWIIWALRAGGLVWDVKGDRPRWRTGEASRSC